MFFAEQQQLSTENKEKQRPFAFIKGESQLFKFPSKYSIQLSTTTKVRITKPIYAFKQILEFFIVDI